MICPICKGTGILTEEQFKVQYDKTIETAKKMHQPIKAHIYEELSRQCTFCKGKGKVGAWDIIRFKRMAR